jgi:hypothetical protein
MEDWMKWLAILVMTFLLSASFHGALAEGVLMGVNFWGEGLIPKATWDDDLQQIAKKRRENDLARCRFIPMANLVSLA